MNNTETIIEEIKELIPVRQSSFILRRIHSLCGIVPLSAFLLFHLFANSYSHRGSPGFNLVVDSLRSMPYLELISLSVLSIPFLFHIIYGVYIIFTGQLRLEKDQLYIRNIAYFLQRISGIVTTVFIFWHVITVKYGLLANDGSDFYQLMRQHFSNPITVCWYTLALLCVAFHIGNGICTFCITWGLTISRHSQRVLFLFGILFAGFLFLLGMTAMLGFIFEPTLYEYAPKP